MKKILIGLMAIASFGFAIEKVNVGNTGGSIPLFSSSDAEINLDTAESNTSDRWLYVGNRAIRTSTDTILGTAWLRCDDSTGTDSIGVRLLVYGNPHPEGKALWEIVDSASVMAASGTETQVGFAVRNTKRYQVMRGVITNRKTSAVGLKSVCRNVRLNVTPVPNP